MAGDFFDSQVQWQQQAYSLAQENRILSQKQGKGPYNVFILDTSSSLGEDGYNQTKETFNAIIDEFSKHPDIDENVAVIVCGRHVKCQHPYSNEYKEIKLSLGNVEFGGPSPLTAAFFLSRGCLMSDYTKRMGTFSIPPRIIFISDGIPTDFTDLYCDDSPQTEKDSDVNQLLQIAEILGREHPIFCIPVGRNPDMTTLEFISGRSRGGKIILPSNGRQFAKYSKNTRTASMLSFRLENDGNDRERILTSLVSTFPDGIFTELDQNDIIEICSRKSIIQSRGDLKDKTEDAEQPYRDRDPRMPSLGSRVRRGKDWHFSAQDNFGPGTVIGHSKHDGLLIVEWDTGSQGRYRFQTTAMGIKIHEVQMCNEPRILENELIATGCIVTGDRNSEDQNGHVENTGMGSVLSVHKNGVVLVHWQHGHKSQHRYGMDGMFDLQICDPFSPEAVRYLEDKTRKIAMITPDGVQSGLDCVSEPLLNKHVEFSGKNTVKATRAPILNVPKGTYFRNDKLKDNLPDVETDGDTFSLAVNQWFWKSGQGSWNPYSREINERINKCFKRNPKSTIVVTIHDQSYRVVIAKNIQINLTTRETSEIKLVMNGPRS